MSGTPAGADGEVEIRPYRPGDEAAIDRGFRRVFGVRRPDGEWAWKFPPAVEVGGRRVMVAVVGDEVVAHMAAQPVRFVVDDRELVGGHLVDAYSSRRDSLARRGAFARTVDLLFATYGGADGLAFVFGFPGERHMRFGRALLGYVEPRAVPYREKDLTGPIAARGVLRRYGLRLAGVRVEEGLVTTAIDDLWRRAAGRYPVAAVRDGRRAAERYAGRPGVAYLHLIARHRRRVAAWAVARIEGDLLRWVELVWDGASAATLVALEEELVVRARAAGARRGEMWLGGDPAAEALLEARGWRPVRHPEGLEMTSVAFVPDLSGVELVQRCYVTLGDSDLV